MTLEDLRRMVRHARELCAGGLHANAADPSLHPAEFHALVTALTHLNQAYQCLDAAPDFEVGDFAAGLRRVVDGESSVGSDRPR